MRAILLIKIIFSTIGVPIEELGTGIVIVDISTVQQIPIFKSKGDKSPEKTITLLQKNGEVVIGNRDYDQWLKPENLWLDYSIFNFRYLGKEGDWIEVVINKETGERKWILMHNGLTSVKWHTFLVEHTTAIDPIAPTEIRDQPSMTAKVIRKSTKQDCFQAIEIQGDWIRIKTNDVLECSEHPEPVETGWIRWQEGNRLLVNYFLTC